MSSVLDGINGRLEWNVTLNSRDFGTLMALARLAERFTQEIAIMGPEYYHKVIATAKVNALIQEVESILHPTPPAPVAPEGPYGVPHMDAIWQSGWLAGKGAGK